MSFSDIHSFKSSSKHFHYLAMPAIFQCSLCLLISWKLSWQVLAIDPFQGNFPVLNCLKERPTAKCNETLWQAYKRSELAATDETLNEPETRFFLFTRRNRKKPEFLHRCGSGVPSNSYYQPEKQTVLVVHGYMISVCEMAVLREIKDQLLFKDDYNVVLIDWPWGCRYDIAGAIWNAKVVGKQTAFLLKMIMDQKGVTEDMFHLVGQSVGGIVAAHAGQTFQDLTGKKMRRITGVDPSLAAVHVDDVNQRLDRSDAQWVDIIHTNIAPCFPGIGDYRRIGHADFYPNGGKVQLSCLPYITESFIKGDNIYAFATMITPLCYHLQSYQYFKVSINACDCQFIGVECDCYEDFKLRKCRDCGADGSKCAVMGMDWEKYPRKPGNFTYYLKTALQCPYCNNDDILLGNFSRLSRKNQPSATCFVPH